MPQIQIDVSWSLEPAHCEKCGGGNKTFKLEVEGVETFASSAYISAQRRGGEILSREMPECRQTLGSNRRHLLPEPAAQAQRPSARQPARRLDVSSTLHLPEPSVKWCLQVRCKRGLKAIRCDQSDKASKDFNGRAPNDTPRVQIASRPSS